MRALKDLLRRLVLALARRCGSKIVDAETGRFLGRAFLLPWKGSVAVIGLAEEVKPVFLPQKRLTFWKQDLGFTVPSAVDFPHEPRPQPDPHAPER